MMEAIIKIKIEKLEEGSYLAASDTLQGLIAQGRTILKQLRLRKMLLKN